MKVRELLRANNVVWVNRKPKARSHEECLLTALGKCYNDNTVIQITRRIRAYLHIRLLFEWNDAPERTFADVLQVVDELDI